MSTTQASLGTVAACWRYPIKSFQGVSLDEMEVGPAGPIGDRAWGIVSADGVNILSAKSTKELLRGRCTDDRLTLPDGRSFPLASGDAELDAALTSWLGRPVRLARPSEVERVRYEMSFGPPDDPTETREVATPAGVFVDWGHLHLITTATLDGAAAARPELDWDVRRFRPNLLLDISASPFVEQTWMGDEITIGDLRIRIDKVTVRCAMPLRAQPDGIEREPKLFRAMKELNEEFPNHLGVYASVIEPGTVSVGDPFEVHTG